MYCTTRLAQVRSRVRQSRVELVGLRVEFPRAGRIESRYGTPVPQPWSQSSKIAGRRDILSEQLGTVQSVLVRSLFVVLHIAGYLVPCQ